MAKNDQIAIRISAETKLRLKKLASRDNRTLSNFIQNALEALANGNA